MIELRVSSDSEASGTFLAVQAVAEEHPGDHELKLIGVDAGGRVVGSVVFGDRWRYAGTVECLEALSEFGHAIVLAGED